MANIYRGILSQNDMFALPHGSVMSPLPRYGMMAIGQGARMAQHVKCSVCGDYSANLALHRCPPIWEWRCHDLHGPNYWMSVRAHDAEQAANMAAAAYDLEAEYYLLQRDGNFVEIEVRDTRSQEVTRWRGFGENRPSYSARRIT